MSGESNTKDNRRVLVLFDVDGTLTPSRLPIGNEIDQAVQKLRKSCVVGLVGGSDINKIADQVLPPYHERNNGINPIEICIKRYDYVFAENGLVAYKNGEFLSKRNIVDELGEENLQKFINFALDWLSKITLPKKRGNFIEFRNGMINVCPVGRSCSQEEREEFAKFDQVHHIRQKFIDACKKEFDNKTSFQYAIGGQISVDVFPEGWDKTFCLRFVNDDFANNIHFFGDKTMPGGNDYELYSDSRVIGHAVTSPDDTLKLIEKLIEDIVV